MKILYLVALVSCTVFSSSLMATSQPTDQKKVQGEVKKDNNKKGFLSIEDSKEQGRIADEKLAMQKKAREEKAKKERLKQEQIKHNKEILDYYTQGIR
jgi:hypothetical protein